MYNIKDILTEHQKEILKKNKIDFDVIIHNDEEMRAFVGKVFDEVAGFNNIQEIADCIVNYHNK